MDEIFTSEQGSRSRGAGRSVRHATALADGGRIPRLRLVALVPLGLAASLAANSVVSAAAHGRPGDASDLLVSASRPVAASSFSSTRDGIGCTGPGTSAARTLALRVQTRVGPAVRAAGSRVAFAAEDSVTGVRCSIRGARHYDSASVIKASIVAALLAKRRTQGRALSSTEQSWARRAITQSDNAAASALWRDVGGAAGMRRFFDRAGMTHTVPGSGGYWGLTQVTAGDQLILLRYVTRKGMLSRSGRHYLQNLMASVISSQRWGVPVGAPSRARVGNKNGWLPRASRAWRVHSIGWVQLHTTTYDVVLLSDSDSSFTSGVRRLDSVARAAHSALGSGRS
jgi:beta-lactamase class A